MARTITDPSELDALPPWAVVEDGLGFAWVRHPGTPGQADHWVSYYGSRVSAQYVVAESPLTVLHDPSAPVVSSATREEVSDVALVASWVTITDSPHQKAQWLRVADALLARFTITPKEAGR